MAGLFWALTTEGKLTAAAAEAAIRDELFRNWRRETALGGLVE
jgi:hypothetical protein